MSGPDRLDTRAFVGLGQPDRTPGTYEVTADNEAPHVMIGTGYGLATPEILLYGQPQPDGTIESPMFSYGLDDPRYARYRINDDSSVSRVFAGTAEERAAIMNATSLMSSDELESIASDISARKHVQHTHRTRPTTATSTLPADRPAPAKPGITRAHQDLASGSRYCRRHCDDIPPDEFEAAHYAAEQAVPTGNGIQ